MLKFRFLIPLFLSMLIGQAWGAQKIKKVALIGIDGVGYQELMRALCINNNPNDSMSSWTNEGYKRSLLLGNDDLLKEWLKGCNSEDNKYVSENLQNLSQNFKVYPSNTGGTPGILSHVDTVSAPGWSTILSGAWYWKHGIFDNSRDKEILVPTLFSYISPLTSESFHTAFVYDWNVLHDLNKKELINLTWQSDFIQDCKEDTNPPEINSQSKYGRTLGDKNCALEDKQVEKDAITQLQDPNMGFLFAYFTFADDWSHQYMEDILCTPINKALQLDTDCSLTKPAISPNFIKAARITLGHAENIIKAIKNRPTFSSEDWLIIVTSDHGRNSFGGHGGDSLPEKLAFIALNKEPNEELSKPVANQKMVDDLKKNLLYSIDYEGYQYQNLDGAANQTDIAPSILSFLGIPIHNFNFDGTSFLGNVGVRKLYANHSPSSPHSCTDLSWISPTNNPSNYRIYRDGVLLSAQEIKIESNIASTQDCTEPLANSNTNYTVEFSYQGDFTDSIFTNTKVWLPAPLFKNDKK